MRGVSSIWFYTFLHVRPTCVLRMCEMFVSICLKYVAGSLTKIRNVKSKMSCIFLEMYTDEGKIEWLSSLNSVII